jgi:hypothetical protein
MQVGHPTFFSAKKNSCNQLPITTSLTLDGPSLGRPARFLNAQQVESHGNHKFRWKADKCEGRCSAPPKTARTLIVVQKYVQKYQTSIPRPRNYRYEVIPQDYEVSPDFLRLRPENWRLVHGEVFFVNHRKSMEVWPPILVCPRVDVVQLRVWHSLTFLSEVRPEVGHDKYYLWVRPQVQYNPRSD